MDFLRFFYKPSEIEYTSKKWIGFFIATMFIVYIAFFININLNFNGIISLMSERMSNMPLEQRQAVLKMLTKKTLLIRGSLGILVSLPLKLLFIAGIFYFISMFLGKEGFSIPLFVASLYVYVQGIGDFLRTLLSSFFHTYPFATDFSLMAVKRGFLKGFLSVFDIFTLYAVYVAAVILTGDDKKQKKVTLLILLLLVALWGVVRGLAIKFGMK